MKFAFVTEQQSMFPRETFFFAVYWSEYETAKFLSISILDNACPRLSI
jgi:hypothetical protein